MGTRPTRKAGLLKPRVVSDPEVKKAIDAIIERLEVLDGLRGDSLDQAVTYRGLGETGFVLGQGAGGAPTIVNTPGGGTDPGGIPIPGIGPAGPPSNLAANETYLALLLTWDNTAFNLQHVEVWRNDVVDFSGGLGAVMIGTTVSPQFVDYVGASATYYYWARSVGTDGTYSAYNAVLGTLGTTGIDPGNLTIDPRFFTLEDGTGAELPFLTDGLGTIGIDGDLIVDGTIRAQSLVADSISADQISSDQVSGIFASFGTMQGGLIRTAASPSFRVELEDQAATFYPLWYGSGAKGDAGGLFYVDQNGNVVVRGLLDAGLIKQSFFTPATSENNSFRIAASYTGSWTPGVEPTKKAHLLPMKSTGYASQFTLGTSPSSTTDFISEILTFYGPTYSGSDEWGRLGTLAEMLMCSFSAGGYHVGDQFDASDLDPYGISVIDVHLEYRYSTTAAWKALTTVPMRFANSGSASFSLVMATRNTAWNTLQFRLRVSINTYTPWATQFGAVPTVHLTSASLSIFSPNFGYADLSLVPDSGTGTVIQDLPSSSGSTPRTVVQLV